MNHNLALKISFQIGNFGLDLALEAKDLRIFTYAPLREFGEAHPRIMPAITAWYEIAKRKEVDWQKPQDVVETFGISRVDVLKYDRVCIDLAGNQVRLILRVRYGKGRAYVRWIGWHKDYDKLGDDIYTI